MTRRNGISWIAPTLLLVPTTYCLAGDDVGPLVRSLWLVHRYGTSSPSGPRTTRRSKANFPRHWAKKAA